MSPLQTVKKILRLCTNLICYLVLTAEGNVIQGSFTPPISRMSYLGDEDPKCRKGDSGGGLDRENRRAGRIQER